jgi:hypothetical protein
MLSTVWFGRGAYRQSRPRQVDSFSIILYPTCYTLGSPFSPSCGLMTLLTWVCNVCSVGPKGRGIFHLGIDTLVQLHVVCAWSWRRINWVSQWWAIYWQVLGANLFHLVRYKSAWLFLVSNEQPSELSKQITEPHHYNSWVGSKKSSSLACDAV